MTYETVKRKNRIETQTEFYEHQLWRQTRAIIYFLLVGIPAIIFNVGLLVVIPMRATGKHCYCDYYPHRN